MSYDEPQPVRSLNNAHQQVSEAFVNEPGVWSPSGNGVGGSTGGAGGSFAQNDGSGYNLPPVNFAQANDNALACGQEGVSGNAGSDAWRYYEALTYNLAPVNNVDNAIIPPGDSGSQPNGYNNAIIPPAYSESLPNAHNAIIPPGYSESDPNGYDNAIIPPDEQVRDARKLSALGYGQDYGIQGGTVAPDQQVGDARSLGASSYGRECGGAGGPIAPDEQVADASKVGALGYGQKGHSRFLPSFEVTGFNQEAPDNDPSALGRAWHKVTGLFTGHETLDDQVKAKVVSQLNPQDQQQYKAETKALEQYQTRLKTLQSSETINDEDYPAPPNCPMHQMVNQESRQVERQISQQVQSQMSPTDLSQLYGQIRQYEQPQNVNPISGPLEEPKPEPGSALKAYWSQIKAATETYVQS